MSNYKDNPTDTTLSVRMMMTDLNDFKDVCKKKYGMDYHVFIRDHIIPGVIDGRLHIKPTVQERQQQQARQVMSE